MKKRKVGAGKAEIVFTGEMLPTFGENYTFIHDNPYVNVLLLEDEERYALVSADIVIIIDREKIIDMISNVLQINRDHVIFHTTHVLATPHFKRTDSVEEWVAKERDKVEHNQAEKYFIRENKMCDALENAINKACVTAMQNVQPAKIGFSLGYAEVNVNRVIKNPNGWMQGTNVSGATDRNVPVISFINDDDDVIAVLFNCNVAPGSMEFSVVDGGRGISGDMAGASEKYIEEHLGKNTVAIYTTGATGDQWQSLRARLDYVDGTGKQVVEDLGEAGFLMPKILGTRLGEQVVKAMSGTLYHESEKPLYLESFRFSYPGQREGSFADSNLDVMVLDNIAILFCGVELGVDSYQNIKEHSPFDYTFIVEFAVDGGGYMAREEYYDNHSFQAGKSRFAKGAAERFEEDVIATLNTVWKK